MLGELPTELARIDTEIAAATAEDARLAGGLLKTLIAVRLEILKTSRVLVRQRIMADAGGAPLSVQIPATMPDPQTAAALAGEIEALERTVEAARADAARYAGGLVQAMKLSSVATQEQSLSMLRQRFLVAKYGLGLPTLAPPIAPNDQTSPSPLDSGEKLTSQSTRLGVRLLKKQLTKQNHQDFIFFDTELTASGLSRPSRAIKGELRLNDLFGETHFTIGWTVEKPLSPCEIFIDRGKGFHYNHFMPAHQWVNTTALENMSASFVVLSILYADGTREDF